MVYLSWLTETYRSYFFSFRLVQLRMCKLSTQLHQTNQYEPIPERGACKPWWRWLLALSFNATIIPLEREDGDIITHVWAEALVSLGMDKSSTFTLGGKCLRVLHVDNYPLFFKLCIIFTHTHNISFACVLFSLRCHSLAGNFGWLFAAASNVVLFLFHYSTHLNFFHTSSFTLHRTKKKRKINHGNY